MDRKLWLEKEITRHNHLYWFLNNPEISDTDYDKLVREYDELVPGNTFTSQIFTPSISSEGKVTHINPMLSLDKVYSKEELLKWASKYARDEDEPFVIELKYDGCSAELANEVLSTRGDGHVGEDISSKIGIIDFDTYSNGKDSKYQRGELILLEKDFEENKHLFVRKDGTPFKNTRQAVPGLLNRDDITEEIKGFIKFINFDYIRYHIPFKELSNFDYEKMKEFSEIPIDGLVVKLADIEYRNSLGFTSHHPKGEIAYKFANPEAETILLDVEWSAGKNDLTPVGKVEPVEISGVTVSNVNLHNMKYIIDKDICIGDILTIERAGDVIPDFVSRVPGENRISITITTCPFCGATVEYIEPKMVCTKDNCVGKKLQKLCDSVTRIGIERLGKPTILKMIEVLHVDSLADILTLKLSQIQTLPGFGETSSLNLFNEIQKVIENGVYEWQILASLNLTGIGKTLSKDLLDKSETIENLLQMDLENFENMGEIRAQILREGIRSNLTYIFRLKTILPVKTTIENGSSESKGTICFTGKFPEQKKFYYKIAEEKGLEVVEKVSKDLTYLAVADPSKGSNKQTTAEKYGVKILSIEQFLQL